MISRQPRRRAGAASIVAAISLVAAVRAQASVQEYQIRRLLDYQSSCRVSHLEIRNADSQALSFHADCEDATLYPSGVDVECADREDERSCRVLTPARSFEFLHQLDQATP